MFEGFEVFEEVDEFEEVDKFEGSTTMNRDQFSGQWKQIKGEAQRMWGKLTNDDLDQVEGNATKLIGRLQERYGYAKEEAEAEFDRFLTRYPDPATGGVR